MLTRQSLLENILLTRKSASEKRIADEEIGYWETHCWQGNRLLENLSLTKKSTTGKCIADKAIGYWKCIADKEIGYWKAYK